MQFKEERIKDTGRWMQRAGAEGKPRGSRCELCTGGNEQWVLGGREKNVVTPGLPRVGALEREVWRRT